MISEKLISVLVCPSTHGPLVLAPLEILERVNSKILASDCYTLEKKRVASPLKEALYEPNSGLLYRIENGIPVLITEEAIETKKL